MIFLIKLFICFKLSYIASLLFLQFEIKSLTKINTNSIIKLKRGENMLFDKNKYYELSEEIRKIIIKCYIIYMLSFTIIGILASFTIPIIKENNIIKIITSIVFIFIGLLLADKKSIEYQIREQEMKWKIDIYNILNKIEK